MDELIKAWTLYLGTAVEVVASLIIAGAVIQATIGAARAFAVAPVVPDAKEIVRLRLGRWLAVALEFELAADIVRTAVAPTWNEIGQLAAIIVLRTALNYFLQREIERATAPATPQAG